jgi:hypothetical protein
LKTKAKLFCSTNAKQISAQDISKLNWLLPTHKIEKSVLRIFCSTFRNGNTLGITPLKLHKNGNLGIIRIEEFQIVTADTDFDPMLSKYEALDQTFLRLISNRSYFRY